MSKTERKSGLGMDFVSDALTSGRRIRSLLILQPRMLSLEVWHSLKGQDVVRALDEIPSSEDCLRSSMRQRLGIYLKGARPLGICGWNRTRLLETWKAD